MNRRRECISQTPVIRRMDGRGLSRTSHLAAQLAPVAQTGNTVLEIDGLPRSAAMNTSKPPDARQLVGWEVPVVRAEDRRIPEGGIAIGRRLTGQATVIPRNVS